MSGKWTQGPQTPEHEAGDGQDPRWSWYDGKEQREKEAIKAGVQKILAMHSAKKAMYLTGLNIWPTLKADIETCRWEFQALQYQIDHTEGCALLMLAITKRGVRGRIILDENNFYDSSCARQAARVEELWKSDCELHVITPPGGNWASMHAKVWIFDKAIYYTGSPNMTHNGMEKNKECGARIEDEDCVADAVEDFERYWLETKPVNQGMIDCMMRKDAKKKDAKKEASAEKKSSRNAKTRGKSSPVKGSRRSLDEELEKLIEEKDDDLIF